MMKRRWGTPLTSNWPTTSKPGMVLHHHGISYAAKAHYFSRIQNPLAGVPRDVLLQRVDDFTREKGLEDKKDLFRKAALLAQNPSDFETIPELSEEDKHVIRRETTRELHPYFFLLCL
jgi:hypothetical protein